MEILIVIGAIVCWMIYEYINAPYYDEKTKRFYKKPKK